MTSPSSFVQEATDDTFQDAVFERSKNLPVVVDFWAEWCAPCRMLAPVLESMAEEYAGKFVLVKANTDQNQRSASEFSVSGIPAVFAVIDGEIVDSFQGVLPEDALRKWLDDLLGKAELQAVRRQATEDPTAAIAQLRELGESIEPEATILLARLLVEDGQGEEASSIIEKLERRGFLEPEAEAVKAQIAVAGAATQDVDALKAIVAADPADCGAKLELAKALAAKGEYEPALIAALETVELDRKGVGEQAREFMIQVFRVLPDGHELTSEYRRKLSMALY